MGRRRRFWAQLLGSSAAATGQLMPETGTRRNRLEDALRDHGVMLDTITPGRTRGVTRRYRDAHQQGPVLER
jgi:hypothetical protein